MMIRYQKTRVIYMNRFFSIYNKQHEKNVIKSKIAEIDIPKQLIQDFVWSNFTKWPTKTAVICFETRKQYSYEELHKRSMHLAINLQNKFPLEQGDKAAIILPNTADFPLVFLGSIQAGLIVTTVNPFYRPEEIAAQLKDSNSKLIFTIPELYHATLKATKQLSKQIPIILTKFKQNDDHQPNCVKLEDLCQANNSPLKSQNPDNIALLPYSSGTTGLPKGVQLTHQNVVSNLHQMSHPSFSIHYETNNQFQETIPVFLPLFHIYAMVGIFLNFLAKGCKLVMVPHFGAPQFIRLVQSFQPTLLFAVPQIVPTILNNPKVKYEDFESIRTLVSAAAPLDLASFEKLNEKTKGRLNVLQMYGMTETSPLTLMQTDKLENGIKPGGSGLLIPKTNCKIISTETFEALGRNQTGELVVQGPQVMKGYHNNPEATRHVFTAEKWLRTGDIGHCDDTGHFFITERLKELIKVKGFQVAPAELEAIIKLHDLVADAAVVGVPHPVQGEAPRAFVVLKHEKRAKTKQIEEFVATKVANYKRLVGGVVFVDKIPRSFAGKILRRQLKTL